MLLLHVTDDRGAVAAYEIKEFPVLIGRSAQAGVRISSAGVFEEHASIHLAPAESGAGERVFIEAMGDALIAVNGVVHSRKQLAIGDEVSVGGARVAVSLSPTLQRKLGFHEGVVWFLLLLIVAAEAVIIQFAR